MSSRRATTPSLNGSESDRAAKILEEPQAPTTTDPVQKSETHPNQKRQKYPSLSEELDRELKELNKIQTPSVNIPEPVREARPMFREPPTSTPSVNGVNIGPGMAGYNSYLALVQARINSMWTAPPVDISGKALSVIIKFRLERNGSVSNVMIEKSSGNEYYDISAHRAIQNAMPFPSFPPNLTDPYLDTHFTFTVGGRP